MCMGCVFMWHGFDTRQNWCGMVMHVTIADPLR